MYHKLELELKQHTPLVSFNGHEQGAFLRMSQLKPAFNKFYSSKLDKADINKFDDQLFLNPHAGKDMYNIDVELDIQFNESDIIYWIPSNKNRLFFGNLGDGHDSLFLFNPTQIIFSISCNSGEMKNFILEHINEFFFTHNFGNRTSKGFGSFYPVDQNISDESLYVLMHDLNVRLRSTDNRAIKDSFSYLFYQISSFIAPFRMLNRTNNNPNKSYILDYFFKFREEMTEGDSNALHLKGRLNSLGIGKENRNQYQVAPLSLKQGDFNSTYLVRGLLGLPESMSYSFQGYDVAISSDNRVLRHASPLYLKIINQNLYLLIDEASLSHLLGAKLTCTLTSKKFRISETENTVDIKIPEAFKINDFMDYCKKEIKKKQ